MIDVAGSCDPEKLRTVLYRSQLAFKGIYGIEKEDREEVLLEVAYRFELDKAKYPVSVYVKFCRQRLLSLLQYKTRKKRKQQEVIGGKTFYYETLSLNYQTNDEDERLETGDSVPVYSDFKIQETEILADIYKKSPDLIPLVKAAIEGEKLTRQQRSLLKKVIRREDLLN